MKVVCINDSGRPKQIPIEKWVVKGIHYTITEIVNMGIQVDKTGVALKEIDLDQTCFPYSYFDADRFAPVKDDSTNAVKIQLTVEEDIV